MCQNYICSNKILGNIDSLIVLFVGKFKNSKIENIFTQNFINIIRANDKEHAQKLINNNSIDIVLFDKSSIDNPYHLLEIARQTSQNIVSVLATKELNTEDLLKSIDLKLDCYLLEDDSNDVLLEKLNTSILKYLSCENAKKFDDYFDENNNKLIVSKTDINGIITHVNNTFCSASGYSKSELIGSNHNITKHPDNQKSLFVDLWHTILEKKMIWQGLIKNISKNGETYYTKSIITPILDENKNIIEFLGIRMNITTMISDQQRLLNNIQSNDLSVLALIQIDEHSVFEEFYNAELLKKIYEKFADRLFINLPKKDIFDKVYNLGNGKYALHCNFYNFMKTNCNMKEYFEQLSEKINGNTLRVSNVDDDINIVLSFAYGKQSLFEDAQQGLEKAILHNKVVFDSNDVCLQEESSKKKNSHIVKMIKVALDNYNIISYFQPIINNKTLEIEKYESLVRMVNEKNQIVEPNSFLDVAKECCYYNKITNRVLENSFAILKEINSEVSINISMSDIEKKETQDIFFRLLNENKEYSNRLVLELLEDESVEDLSIVKKFIKKAKAKGVQIAIDDFGAGYSNFERLLIFEPDIIKIDGSLIKNIENDIFSRNLVETISSLSKKQNIKTVAEYVENENIFNILNTIGIDYSQGYFFGKPENMGFSFQNKG